MRDWSKVRSDDLDAVFPDLGDALTERVEGKRVAVDNDDISNLA
jgi:hypothetical protein